MSGLQDKKTILITGGCGFIGSNACKFYLDKGYKVVAFDDLSRQGAAQNLEWLKTLEGDFVFVQGDVRNYDFLLEVFREYKPDYILHLAAQVAMTTSVENPRYDFEVNALGTFNVLEATRHIVPDSPLLYTSTNKVYGETRDIPVIEKEKRYEYKDRIGVSESQPLDFHGPYGVSKGTGDQYTVDYARIFGLKTVVFRQSAIYGPHQFGIEDQGWLAWFCNALIFDKPVTIYGDGKQVRDVLFVDDVLLAYEKAFENIEKTKGQVYNMGGGPNFSLSIWELFDILESYTGKKFNYSFGPWRPGDQKVYISDISKAKKDLGWEPKVGVEEGVRKLYDWIFENKHLIEQAKVFK